MPHRLARRRVVAPALAAVVVVVLASCSSGSDASTTTTTKPKTSTTRPAATTTTADLVAAAAEHETVSNEVAPADRTVTITKAGRFQPDIVEAKVGESVSFVVEKGLGVAVISFNGVTIYPINEGTPVNFTFAKPGTHTVTDIDSDQTGTVSITK